MLYYVYILYSAKTDRYYVGSTGNIEDRLTRHNQGRSKATKGGTPWILKYKASFSTRSLAYQQEMSIKAKKSRTYIETLISSVIV
jgi:putative endonuclease